VAPRDLTEAAVASALADSWDVAVASMAYLPVGWGSHHWEVVDESGSSWFVTADEIETKRLSASESMAAGFHRLRSSLATARALRECGRTFVVAPVPASDGEVVVRVGEQFAVAVYPFVHGRTYRWGELTSVSDRLGVLEMVTAVHTAPGAARRHALADEFAIPYRVDLEAAGNPVDCGPYAGPASVLLRGHAGVLQRLLARYDELVTRAWSERSRAVLTHGEPHPGNTMRTDHGWLLIDWDTVLVAPPERDLWHLESGDGSVLGAYAEATGVSPLPWLLDLYRMRWDLTDVALEAARFRRPHTGSANDEKAWRGLNGLLERLSVAERDPAR
jgi:spectinomycin phosphotransferase